MGDVFWRFERYILLRSSATLIRAERLAMYRDHLRRLVLPTGSFSRFVISKRFVVVEKSPLRSKPLNERNGLWVLKKSLGLAGEI